MLDALLATINKLLNDVGIKGFETLCSLDNLQQTLPPPDAHITRLLIYSLPATNTQLLNHMLQPYVFTLRHPTDRFLIRKLLKGMQRTLNHKDKRLSMTLNLLNGIILTLQTA